MRPNPIRNSCVGRGPLQRITHITIVALLVLSHPLWAATIIVDETTCTLVDAITAANTDTATGGCPAGSGADTIELTSDVMLTVENNTFNGLPHVLTDITVEGGGFTIERDASAPPFRFFDVRSALTLNEVTLRGGSTFHGGAIRNKGLLFLTNSTLSGNSAIGGGGAILNEPYRPVYLTNSTLSYNSASHGGAISTRYDSDVLVTNCTLSGNSATLKGGAVYVGDLGAVLLKSSTLSGNSGSGGAIRTYFAWVGLDDTIIANSSSGQNCVTGGDLDDLGNNFSDDDSCGPGFADITPGVDFETELTDNGGPTLTHALLPWSVAMDAAGECGLDTDQRGFPRSDGVCDSGSVEFQGGSGVPASSRVGVIVLLAVLAALSVILRPKRGARRPST